MTHAEVQAWEGFALAMASASAVLAGLIFIAVSINVREILQTRGLPGRAGESLIHFVSVLWQCALVLVPEQSITALGVELVIAGAVTWALLMVIALAAARLPSRQPFSWHATRIVAVQATTIPAVVAGASLLGPVPGGLLWFAVGVLLALTVGTANAWVLLVEVVRDERYQPAEELPGLGAQPASDPPLSEDADREMPLS